MNLRQLPPFKGQCGTYPSRSHDLIEESNERRYQTEAKPRALPLSYDPITKSAPMPFQAKPVVVHRGQLRTTIDNIYCTLQLAKAGIEPATWQP